MFLKKLFKKDKQTQKEVDILYSTLKEKTDKYTKEEIKTTIQEEGYKKKVANKVVKKLAKKGCKFRKPKNTKKSKKNKSKKKKDKSKEKNKILKELSKNIASNKIQDKLDKKKQKHTKKEKKKSKKQEKVKSKKSKNKSNIFKKIKVFFAKLYFSFEDKYYSLIDKIDKKVKISPFIDSIDKYFPSFILFIIIIFALIYFIFFTGLLSFGPNMFTLNVQVVDSSDNAIKEVHIDLLVDDQNIESKKTDVFGEAEFRDITNGDLVEVVLKKEEYEEVRESIVVDSEYVEHKVSLDINTNPPGPNPTPAQERHLYFLYNNMTASGDTLEVNLHCSNQEKAPEPSSQSVATGELVVYQPGGCNKLKIDVISEEYETITNRTVPVNNNIILDKISGNTGYLNVNVKNVSSESIGSSDVTIYAKSNPEISVTNGLTDMYGHHKFELTPGNYLVSAYKENTNNPYISLGKKGPFRVVKEDTSSADYVLVRLSDLDDINCNNSYLSQFCKDGELDCDNQLLQDYLLQHDDGTCEVGEFGFLNIFLKDQDTQDAVSADIVLSTKEDENTFEVKETRHDINQTHFVLAKHKTYMIKVESLMQQGYITPEPMTINEFDTNKTIYLEYSDQLNSGTVTSNVKDKWGNAVSNASVYLYYGDGEYEDVPVSNQPQITDVHGDVNFTARANQEYYTYAFYSSFNQDGFSRTDELDVNEVLELDVDLENQSKTLELTVNTNEYDINFFNISDEPIEDYVIEDLEDNQKNYIFKCSENKLYAILKAPGYASYQTSRFTLIPGQSISKEVNLQETLPPNVADTGIEFLGVYDQEGISSIEEINVVDNGLQEEYSAKFRYYASGQENKSLAYAFIKAGPEQTISSSNIYLTDIDVPNADVDYGCIYAGEIEDWNGQSSSAYISENYDNDHDESYCQDNSLEKWTVLDFTQAPADYIEFYINFKFNEQPAPLESYKLFYRSLNQIGAEFSFSPYLDDWIEWNIARPNCYFYAPSKVITSEDLGFPQDQNYNINYRIYDQNGDVLETDPYVSIRLDKNYIYDLNFVYLVMENLEDRTFIQSSRYTSYIGDNYNLFYNYLNYYDNEDNNISLSKSDLNNDTGPVTPGSIEVLNQIINIGYISDLNSVFYAGDFFPTDYEADEEPQLISNIFNIEDLDPLGVPLYVYADPDVKIEINTTNCQSQFFYPGNNTVNISAVNEREQLVDYAIDVEYKLPGSNFIDLGTLSDGTLSGDIAVEPSFIAQNITFKLTAPGGEWEQFEFSSITREMPIMTAMYLGDEDGNYLSSDLLNVDIINFSLNNGMLESTLKKYSVINRSKEDVTLDDITFNTDDTRLNSDEINSFLDSSENTTISAVGTNCEPERTMIDYKIFMQEGEDLEDPADAFLKNVFDLGISLSENKKLVLDADLVISSSDVNLSGNVSSSSGVYENEDGDIFVEFIEDISETVDFNYSLENITDEAVSLESVEIEDNTYVDVSANSTSMDNTTLTFTCLEAFDSIQTINLNFNLVLDDSGTDFNFSLPVNLEYYTKDELLSVNSASSAITMTCKQGVDCISSKSFDLKNETKSYDFNLSTLDLNITDPSIDDQTNSLPLGISRNPQEDISENLIVSFSTTYDSNTLYKEIPAELELDLFVNSISDSDFNVLEDVLFNIYMTQNTDPASTLEQYGLTGNFCIGDGGQINSADDFFILADCADQSDSCMTGEEVLPNVYYNWSDIPGFDCVSNSTNYESKNHCDSTQMLLSILKKAADGDFSGNYDPDNPSYIYLMADGISDNFFSDFNKFLFKEFEGGFDDSIINPLENTNILYSSDPDYTLKLNKYYVNEDGEEESTSKPGKYEIILNEDFSTSQPSNLDISLKLIQNLPYSQTSLFYYLPLDGPVGFNNETNKFDREGYGFSANYTAYSPEKVVKVIEDSSFTYLYNSMEGSNPFTDLIVSNYNNISTIDFKSLNNREGKLLSFNLLDSSSNNFKLQVIYSPAYPIPLYAKAENIDDYNLEYTFYENPTNPTVLNLSANIPSILKWKDYNKSLYIEDTSSLDPTQTIYNKSFVDFSKNPFIKYSAVDGNHALLKTMLYLPYSGNQNIANLGISLDGTSSIDLSNDSNTLIYTLDNPGGTRESSFSDASRISEDIRSISDIFTLVEEGKACIYNSLGTTYIRWVDDEVDFTEDNKQTIEQSFEDFLNMNPVSFGECG